MNLPATHTLASPRSVKMAISAAFWSGGLALFFLLLGAGSLRAAEKFGDILVAPQSLHAGETQHGYAEFRFLLENQSASATHQVTIVIPNRSFGGGNVVRRISRTVSLGPNTQSLVSLWQPPLPVQGDGQAQVLVDGDFEGTVSFKHFGYHRHRVMQGLEGSGGALLLGRSLDKDQFQLALLGKPEDPYTAQMATGEPDPRGTRGLRPTVWCPDPSVVGSHFLELEYDRPIPGERLSIYEAGNVSCLTQIILSNEAGHEFARIASGVGPGTRLASTVRTYSIPISTEPIKKVRLEFVSSPRQVFGIDAVSIGGRSGVAWASRARASSSPPPGASLPTLGGPVQNAHHVLRAELPVSNWSEQWLSYTPYDAIVLPAVEWDAAPAGVQQVLWRYAESGGTLVLLGRRDVPEPWRAFPDESVPKGVRYYMGYGQCLQFDVAQLSELTPKETKVISAATRAYVSYWRALPGEQHANSAFPVIENLRIPVRGMIFIMLGFILVIGPANLIVLSRLKRRTWMLWTIPAISVLTCGVVFAYSMLREGVTPDTRIEGVTLLDQVNRRATTLGFTAFYCPLTPNRGLTFDVETEVTPLVELYTHHLSSSREVDWTQSQHLRRGWVTARVPAHFFLRKSETRRERIQLETTPNGLRVVNGLGVPIKSLWLSDFSGKLFAASDQAAGAQAGLSPLPGPASSPASPRVCFEFLHGLSFATQVSAIPTNAPALLWPGTYIATVEAAPFLEHGLGAKAESARTKARSVVYGILDR